MVEVEVEYRDRIIEKIVEKEVEVPVYVDKVVEKIVKVDKIVEKKVMKEEAVRSRRPEPEPVVRSMKRKVKKEMGVIKLYDNRILTMDDVAEYSPV